MRLVSVPFHRPHSARDDVDRAGTSPDVRKRPDFQQSDPSRSIDRQANKQCQLQLVIGIPGSAGTVLDLCGTMQLEYAST